MKVTLGGVKFSVGLLVLFLGLSGGFIHAQSSAFNYQGRLTEGANPANGIYDIEVRAFDAATSGTQVGATKSFTDVSVSNGIFSINIDLGAAAFPGADRWLEIRVRAGASTGPFTLLSPRQPITSTPYAVNAAQLGGVAANQYLLATEPRLQSTLSTTSGFMIAGTNNAQFCSEGSCRPVPVSGLTTSSAAQCGADGCMVSGTNQVVYCRNKGVNDPCVTTPVSGATPSGATVRCSADGCMIPGSNQAVYCSRGACVTIDVSGASASSATVRCGEDGCMIPGSNQAIYCSRGTCLAPVAATGVSTAVCGTRGCMAPSTDHALYCFQGACQLIDITGATGSSNVAAYVR